MLQLLLLSVTYSLLGVVAYHPSKVPQLFSPSIRTSYTFLAASNQIPEHFNDDALIHKKQRPEKKPFRRKNSHSSENKLQWLQQATDQLVQHSRSTGSLNEGKWHEAISLFNAWASFRREPDTDAPYHMETLLNALINERNITGNVNIDITIDTYNKVLDAWACSALFNTVSNPIVSSQRVHEILVALQENYEQSTYSTIPTHQPQNNNATSVSIILPIKPNSESFHIALHVLCKVEGVMVARRLLAYMEHLHRNGKNVDAKPSRSHYMQILDAYSKLDSYQSCTLSEAFLRHIKHVNDKSFDVPLPDTLCYNIVMRAWSRQRRGREAAEHADRLLEEMKETKAKHCRPDIITYGSVISAWASSGMKVHAINRVEKILREIEDSDYLEINTVVLNALMSAWVKAKNPAAIMRTEEILRQMELSTNARPDLVSYNTYLHALSMHSNAKRPHLSHQAETLLRRIDDQHKSGLLPFGPNTFSYNLVIESISRGQQDSRAVARVAMLLREMIHRDDIEPDTFSFNQVLTLLSKTSTNSSNVEELFRHMDNSYKAGIYMNAKPDAVSFCAVIQAYARQAGRPSAENAERMLEEMKHRFKNGEEHLKPTRLCYNTVIDCWAKSGEGTYGARKAEALLQEMLDIAFTGDTDLSPNIITFNSVLNAWARSGTRCCGYKAERYLNQMWQLYNSGNIQVKPNDFSYNTVINAISKSKHEEKGQKALRVLRRMDKLYQAGNKEARPNEITYTAVINSCAFPSVGDLRTRKKALDTAIFTLNELQGSRYGQPNQVTYGTFIRACSNLLHDNDEMRRAIIKKAFEQCCEDGQVGQMVLNYIPKNLYGELLDGYFSTANKITLDDIPIEWKRNVDAKIQWGSRRNVKVNRFVERHDRGSEGAAHT